MKSHELEQPRLKWQSFLRGKRKKVFIHSTFFSFQMPGKLQILTVCTRGGGRIKVVCFSFYFGQKRSPQNWDNCMQRQLKMCKLKYFACLSVLHTELPQKRVQIILFLMRQLSMCLAFSNRWCVWNYRGLVNFAIQIVKTEKICLIHT